jgi:hypothetical protein
MARADHIGRGVLLDVSGVTAAQTSLIFMDTPGTSKTVVCCHSTVASTAADATGTGLIIEVEDPTTEKATTFSGFTFSTQDVAANTVRKVLIDGGAGSRLRCKITPNGSADIKIWAYSAR